jgi:hypothetical protein
LFTARIRAWAASLFGFDVHGDTREGPVTKGLVKQAQFEVNSFYLYLLDEVWYSHWVSHLYEALNVLSKYLVDDGDLREAQFLLTLLRSDPNDWVELFEQEYGSE